MINKLKCNAKRKRKRSTDDQQIIVSGSLAYPFC